MSKQLSDEERFQLVQAVYSAVNHSDKRKRKTVIQACKDVGLARSTYNRWKKSLDENPEWIEKGVVQPQSRAPKQNGMALPTSVRQRMEDMGKRYIYPIIPRQPDSWLNPGHGHSTATRPQFHRPFLPAAGVPVRSAATHRVRDHWPLPSAATSTTPHWHAPRRGCH